MNWPAHAVASVAAALALAFFLQVPFTPALIAIAILAGIAADADNSESKAFKLFAAIAFAGVFVLSQQFFQAQEQFATNAIPLAILASFAAIGIIFIFKPKHRGITHSFLAALVFTALVFVLLNDLKLAGIAFACYSTHLLLDLEFKIV
ncbi:MAG: metal-dependent hydrolase [Candidatus Micrarchaeota archaeon]